MNEPRRSTRCLCLAALAAAALLPDLVLAATPTPRPAEAELVGRRVPNFILPDANGKDHSLSDFREKRIVVLAFLSTGCPIGNRYLPFLNELDAKYKDQGVQVLGIYANAGDAPHKIAEHQEKFKIAFPVLRDGSQQVLQATGARRTPEVFLLDSRRVIRYRGRIDDRFGYDHQKEAATRDDLDQAVQDVLARREVSVKETLLEGCLITPIKRERPAGAVTYAEHVAPILQSKCQSCHHPGAVAPFSLLTADDAVEWSAMLKQVVLERRMPPWHADPRYGKFSNDRSLNQEQIETLVDWVDGGTPLGDESKTPPPREFSEGWMIGQPDVVFELPQEVTVPATGTVPYRYFETPTNFKEDMWISAAECRPGNRSVVHHVIVFYRDPKGRRGDIGHQWVAGTAPGDMALVLPPGVARKIPAGATLVWQVHYTPSGKEETDRSQIGLVFYKEQEPPRYNVATRGIENKRLRLPPGADNYEVTSNLTVPRDAIAYSLMPHMHLRGKDFEYRATYPDGKTEVLLSVPRYDFSWQSTYRFAEPLRLPAGTRVECVAHFDNSTDNPANPDPTKSIAWGEQTWDEMMVGYVDYTWAEPSESSGAKP